MIKYVVALSILICLVSGCDNSSLGRAGPEPSTSTSVPATVATPRDAQPHDAQPEPTYTMPPNLCSAISWQAFTDAYPDQPVRQTAELDRKDDPGHASTAACTALVGQAADGLFLTIEAKIYLRAASADEDFRTWRNFDTQRLSDVEGADAIGSAAYLMSDRILGAGLVVVHGNALLRFSVRELGGAGHIPLGDPAQRLRNLAIATLAGLPQVRRSTAATWPPFGPQP